MMMEVSQLPSSDETLVVLLLAKQRREDCRVTPFFKQGAKRRNFTSAHKKSNYIMISCEIFFRYQWKKLTTYKRIIMTHLGGKVRLLGAY